MAKFLDESGVSTLWSKAKSSFSKIGYLGSNANFNNVTDGGMYRYDTNPSNGPSGGGEHGQLLVVRGAGDTIAQLCFPYADLRMFLRTGNAAGNPSGTWNGWVEIANTNDLNNYLPLSGGQVNGNISFASIGENAASSGIAWSGSTDAANIRYDVAENDDGRLVIESTDDSNAKVIIRNNNQGTLHDTVFENGTVTIDEKLIITNKTTADRELIKLADDIDLVDYQDCRLGIRCNTANDFGIHFKGDAGRDATYMFPSSGGTLAINASNGFNPDNFNDGNTWLNHTDSQNEVGNSNRPLVLYGSQIKNNSGQTMATEEYVNNKMPTFSFSNGVLTITTH